MVKLKLLHIADIALLKKSVASPLEYDSSSRKARKYTNEIDELLNDI
jgi:hypothetical protein